MKLNINKNSEWMTQLFFKGSIDRSENISVNYLTALSILNKIQF